MSQNTILNYFYYDYNYVKRSNAFGLGLEGNIKNSSFFLEFWVFFPTERFPLMLLLYHLQWLICMVIYSS